MSKVRELEAKLNKLQAELDELKKTIVTKELAVLRENKKRLDEITSDLSKIKFSVKTANYIEDQNGNKYVKVVYDIPTQIVAIRDDGRPIRNEMFRSINNLSLLNEEGYAKVRKALEEAQKHVDF